MPDTDRQHSIEFYEHYFRAVNVELVEIMMCVKLCIFLVGLVLSLIADQAATSRWGGRKMFQAVRSTVVSSQPVMCAAGKTSFDLNTC